MRTLAAAWPYPTRALRSKRAIHLLQSLTVPHLQVVNLLFGVLFPQHAENAAVSMEKHPTEGSDAVELAAFQQATMC